MTIRSLALTNFRSYRESSFVFHPGTTLVVGPNASGKTNLLEAIYVLASAKSFRARDRDLVHHETSHYRLVGRSEDNEFSLGYSTSDGHQEKRATRDGVKIPLVRHVGSIQATLFEPNDLALVSGPPEGRRRYLDYILCQTDRSYLTNLQRYRRVLRQRNALLEGFAVESLRQEIFAWDLKLTELAVEIYLRRQDLINYLRERIEATYASIAGSTVGIDLTYLPSVAGDYAESFLETLSRNLTRDLAAGFTTIGPHREDFEVRFRDHAVDTIASRGEVRTLVLGLKLGELAYCEAATQIRPLLLLDDVFSELDRDRRRLLLQLLSGHQSVITTTDADVIASDLPSDHAVITPHEGAHV